MEGRLVQWKKTTAEQSEKCKWGSCRGASKCTAQLAVDGRRSTHSVTEYNGKDSWWQCEMKDRYLVKKIKLYLSDYAYNMGAYRHLKVKIYLTLSVFEI